jgi:hypothetical protein
MNDLKAKAKPHKDGDMVEFGSVHEEYVDGVLYQYTIGYSLIVGIPETEVDIILAEYQEKKNKIDSLKS